jgi:hypothetical protein
MVIVPALSPELLPIPAPRPEDAAVSCPPPVAFSVKLAPSGTVMPARSVGETERLKPDKSKVSDVEAGTLRLLPAVLGPVMLAPKHIVVPVLAELNALWRLAKFVGVDVHVVANAVFGTLMHSRVTAATIEVNSKRVNLDTLNISSSNI